MHTSLYKKHRKNTNSDFFQGVSFWESVRCNLEDPDNNEKSCRIFLRMYLWMAKAFYFEIKQGGNLSWINHNLVL